jgi:hypothetical protein
LKRLLAGHDIAALKTSAQARAPKTRSEWLFQSARDPAIKDAWVHAIPDELLTHSKRLVALASNHITAGEVKLTSETLVKMRTMPLAGSLEFRPGDAIEDPLRVAALVGVVLALSDTHELRAA